jgi:hypothetical protein
MDHKEPDPIESVYRVSIGRIRNVVNPFKTDVWGNGYVVTRAQVTKAIKENRLESRPHSMWGEPPYQDKPSLFDIERIAYLVVNKDPAPVEIEVIDQWGHTVFHDGCHRVAAALYRGDRTIDLTFGGYVKAFHRRFKPILVPPTCASPSSPTSTSNGATPSLPTSSPAALT